MLNGSGIWKMLTTHCIKIWWFARMGLLWEMNWWELNNSDPYKTLIHIYKHKNTRLINILVFWTWINHYSKNAYIFSFSTFQKIYVFGFSIFFRIFEILSYFRHCLIFSTFFKFQKMWYHKMWYCHVSWIIK